jgi:hypothetical protein
MSLKIQATDEDTKTFVQELREECLILYRQMLITAGETGKLNDLKPSLPNIFDYIETLIQLEGYANLKITK